MDSEKEGSRRRERLPEGVLSSGGGRRRVLPPCALGFESAATSTPTRELATLKTYEPSASMTARLLIHLPPELLEGRLKSGHN